MNSRCTVALIALATAAGWIALLVNMLPWVELDAADRVFAAVVAISGTASLAVMAASRPVREVYEMGRAAGQREAKIEESARKATRTVVRRHRPAGQGPDLRHLLRPEPLPVAGGGVLPVGIQLLPGAFRVAPNLHLGA